MALIEVSNLTKDFSVEKGIFKDRIEYVHALRDITFSLERGRILGLVGESGSV